MKYATVYICVCVSKRLTDANSYIVKVTKISHVTYFTTKIMYYCRNMHKRPVARSFNWAGSSKQWIF